MVESHPSPLLFVERSLEIQRRMRHADRNGANETLARYSALEAHWKTYFRSDVMSSLRLEAVAVGVSGLPWD
jgi:hypothetical protein